MTRCCPTPVANSRSAWPRSTATPRGVVVAAQFGDAGKGAASLGIVSVSATGVVSAAPLMTTGPATALSTTRIAPTGVPGVFALSATYVSTATLSFGTINVNKTTPADRDAVLALFDTKLKSDSSAWKFTSARRIEPTQNVRTRGYALTAGSAGVFLGGDAGASVGLGGACPATAGPPQDGFLALFDATMTCVAARSVPSTGYSQVLAAAPLAGTSVVAAGSFTGALWGVTNPTGKDGSFVAVLDLKSGNAPQAPAFCLPGAGELCDLWGVAAGVGANCVAGLYVGSPMWGGQKLAAAGTVGGGLVSCVGPSGTATWSAAVLPKAAGYGGAYGIFERAGHLYVRGECEGEMTYAHDKLGTTPLGICPPQSSYVLKLDAATGKLVMSRILGRASTYDMALAAKELVLVGGYRQGAVQIDGVDVPALPPPSVEYDGFVLALDL